MRQSNPELVPEEWRTVNVVETVLSFVTTDPPRAKEQFSEPARLEDEEINAEDDNEKFDKTVDDLNSTEFF